MYSHLLSYINVVFRTRLSLFRRLTHLSDDVQLNTHRVEQTRPPHTWCKTLHPWYYLHHQWLRCMRYEVYLVIMGLILTSTTVHPDSRLSPQPLVFVVVLGVEQCVPPPMHVSP